MKQQIGHGSSSFAQRLTQDGASSSSSPKNDDGNFLPYFGTEDVFIPLKFRMNAVDIRLNGEYQQQGKIPSNVIHYFFEARKRYQSCSSSTNSSNRYFDNNESGEGDRYFEQTFNDLRSNYSQEGVAWSTAMIKHSMPNVLLTMARGIAVLNGRTLVRKEDIDEAKGILIEVRRS
jgi:hypothetical protein